jgi:hypothetical protein
VSPTAVADKDDVERPQGVSGALVGGAVTFPVFYLLSVVSAQALKEGCTVTSSEQLDQLDVDLPDVCDPSSVDAMYVPIAGPFITMANLDGTLLSVWPADVALVSLGLGQLVGAGLLVAGAIDHGQRGEEGVELSPSVGPNGAGLSVTGRF